MCVCIRLSAPPKIAQCSLIPLIWLTMRWTFPNNSYSLPLPGNSTMKWNNTFGLNCCFDCFLFSFHLYFILLLSMYSMWRRIWTMKNVLFAFQYDILITTQTSVHLACTYVISTYIRLYRKLVCILNNKV